MFDLTISEQISPTKALSKRQDASYSRPIRFQSASEEQILSFFRKFTIQERMTRFGTAASDDVIRAWRDSLDRSHYVAVSLEQGHRIVGLVELFGSILTGWKRPELALAICGQRDASAVRLHLLEIGLGAARERGANDVFFAFNSDERCMHAIARQYGGTLDHEAGTAIIPCGFVPKDGVSSWRGTV
jgi:hypothetical protein